MSGRVEQELARAEDMAQVNRMENPDDVESFYRTRAQIWEEERRAEGRVEGRAEGRVEGRAEGRVEGRAEGRVEGRAEGRAEGRVEGRAEGRVEGRVEGRAEGRVEGRAEGRVEGRAEGRVEGRITGQRESLCRHAAMKFDAQTAGRLAVLLDGVTDQEAFDSVLAALLECDTPSDVLARVTEARRRTNGGAG